MKRKKLTRQYVTSIFLVNLVTNSLLALLGILLWRLELLQTLGPIVFAAGYLLLVAILGSAASARVSGQLFARVGRLAAAMERVGRGDFGVRLPEGKSADELGEMERCFNAMAGQLGRIELMRTDFVENVSHELKTPAAAVMGWAELLRGELPEEERRRCADALIRSARQLAALTENVLLLSRLEHGDAPPEKAPFHLDRQLREVLLAAEPAWSEKELRPELTLAPCEYCGSEALLRQVWQNLIGNAVKFSPRGGALGLVLERTGGEVRVTVSDEGPGIDARDRERIFEKFYQADRSHAAAGNGLGLPLARRIVELHGGRIELESEPGRGSRFTVILP